MYNINISYLQDAELKELTQQYYKLTEDATKLDNLNLALQASIASHENSLRHLEACWKQKVEDLEQERKHQIEEMQKQLDELSKSKEDQCRNVEAAKSEANTNWQILEKDLEVEREARFMLELQVIQWNFALWKCMELAYACSSSSSSVFSGTMLHSFPFVYMQFLGMDLVLMKTQ